MSEPNRSAPVVLPSPWRPLRVLIFRNLLIADLVSDMGTFMQSVGAAWLMASLSHSPLHIALIQTASALPFFLLALPAGSIGDILDRRRLILGTEVWMFVVAAVLAVTTIAGAITPWVLLLLTFSLSMGDAIEAPTWRAILPEVVKKELIYIVTENVHTQRRSNHPCTVTGAIVDDVDVSRSNVGDENTGNRFPKSQDR